MTRVTQTCTEETELRLDHLCAYRMVLECAPEGVVVFDKTGRSLYCNEAFASLNSSNNDVPTLNILSKHFYANPERDLPLVHEQLRAGATVGSLEVAVSEAFRPLRWVEMAIRQVTIDDEVNYVAIIRDVGRRVRLLHERERIISVQQTINEAILEGTLEEMIRSACTKLAQLYNADWVGVALLCRDGEGEYFRYKWSHRVPADVENERFPRDGESSLTAFAAENGYAVIDDYQTAGVDRFPRRSKALAAKVRAVESVALRDRHGQLVGVLSLFKNKPGFFREGDNEISLSLAARDLANIIEAKKLEEEIRLAGITDSLTGLYNTRHFYRRLSEEMKRSGRSGRPLTVLLFDLDNYKEYNDRAGHVAGDHLLRRVGEIVNSTLRAGSDLAFRYGGDEFVVLLPETDVTRARRVATRIRKKVRDIQIADISVSLGLAEYRGEASPEELVRRADRAMYKAKSRGKDRVVVDRPRRNQQKKDKDL